MAKIIGGTASTTMPVPDWNQTDPKKADYIKNKPDLTEKPWVKVESITLTEDVTQIVPNFPTDTYKEVFVRGSFKYTRTDDKTTGTTSITLGNATGKLSYSRISNTGSVNTMYYYMAEGKMLADGTPLYEVTSSTSQYAGASTAKNAYPHDTFQSEYLPAFSIYIATSGVYFASGATFEIWGR